MCSDWTVRRQNPPHLGDREGASGAELGGTCQEVGPELAPGTDAPTSAHCQLRDKDCRDPGPEVQAGRVQGTRPQGLRGLHRVPLAAL